MSAGHTDTAENAEILLQVGLLPVLAGLLEAILELLGSAVEDLTDGASELLGAPEGAVGDVDVDRERLVEFVVKDGAEGGEDTLESLDTVAEIKALFATLEEGLLDLGVLLARPLTHDVVKEIYSVNALVAPRGLTLEEGMKVGEVDLAGVT
jgi:hypothetical protein